MVIDAHQHFWNYNPIKHEWINDAMSVIRRDFLPDDLRPIYDVNGVDGCVAVQADQTNQETDFLLDLAKNNDFIKGVVGWVDLRSSKVESELEAYAENPHLKGMRHVVQGEADHNFMLRSDFMRGIGVLEKFDLTYDILVFPHQLGSTLELVNRFPNQKFVVDHIAKPYIKDGFYEGWATMMKEIAAHSNVYCKLSGMTTEADYDSWKPEQIEPYMTLALDSFGSDRIMYGSDWPVCLVAGSYEKTKKLVTDFISGLSMAEQTAIMGLNAATFYNIKI